MKFTTGLLALVFFVGVIVSLLTLGQPLVSALTGLAAATSGAAAVAVSQRDRRRRQGDDDPAG
ncbi:hypothetical protein [Microbacterium sp. SLBN-146]|uniref:hypothetical protein n=1 Tax=Microbacterium sp. SLBN-146 TaxID=2768457 RepID=UPI001151BC40|nr:hypothetical protein [Microbacterium sp. SLBN-146]TQJ31834.1 hypothetical protein FBY39_2319 [Microbacterium sp. SLBN-146]